MTLIVHGYTKIFINFCKLILNSLFCQKQLPKSKGENDSKTDGFYNNSNVTPNVNYAE